MQVLLCQVIKRIRLCGHLFISSRGKVRYRPTGWIVYMCENFDGHTSLHRDGPNRW